MEMWDFAHCLPYFKKMETALAAAPDDPWRGHDGPLVLERGPATSPLFRAFFEAAQEAGYPLTDDVNGYRQEGFAPFDRNIHRGRRLSAARAYLHPILRPAGEPGGLDASIRDRGIAFDGSRAIGVDVARGLGGRGGVDRYTAGEVILAGGAINSPQLLLLSGIGPARELDELGIDGPSPTCPASAATCRTTWRSTSSTSACARCRCNRRPPSSGAGRSSAPSGCSCAPGPGASNHFEGGGFVRSNDDVTYPNLMFHFLPLAIRYDGSAGAKGHGYQVHVGPMYSDARGTLTLASRDPREHPALRFNYLSTAQDRREWVEAIRVARDILDQPALDEYDGGETSPGPSVSRPTSRSSTGSDATLRPHSTRRAPRGWASTTCRSSTR